MPSMAQLLLQHGADKEKDGRVALGEALNFGMGETARALLSGW